MDSSVSCHRSQYSSEGYSLAGQVDYHISVNTESEMQLDYDDFHAAAQYIHKLAMAISTDDTIQAQASNNIHYRDDAALVSTYCSTLPPKLDSTDTDNNDEDADGEIDSEDYEVLYSETGEPHDCPESAGTDPAVPEIDMLEGDAEGEVLEEGAYEVLMKL